jgi:plasmid maintenance system antidote protein VapI
MMKRRRYFGVSEGFFLGPQSDYDLMERRRQIEAKLAAIPPRSGMKVKLIYLSLHPIAKQAPGTLCLQ